MITENFCCPNCGYKLPFKQSLWISNFSKIKCNECGSILKPRLFKSALIGGIFGGLSGGLVFIVSSIVMKYFGLLNGLLAGLGVGLCLWIICSLTVYFFLELEVIQRGETPYLKKGKYRTPYLQSEDSQMNISQKEPIYRNIHDDKFSL
jgi:hypothetical protein